MIDLLEITPGQERALRDIAQATRKTPERLDDALEQMCLDSMRCCVTDAGKGSVEWTTNDSRWSFIIRADGFWFHTPNDLS